MSWSVNASGKIEDVRGKLSAMFKPADLTDGGERRTVQMVQEMIDQCLSTFGPDKSVSVSAYGHMAFTNWETKEGAYQQVTVLVKPELT